MRARTYLFVQLIIDDYGSYISQKDNLFQIKGKDGKIDEYSADKVEQIIVLKNSAISSSAILLAAKNNIDIVIIGDFGMPVGRFFPASLGGANLVRRKQLEAATNGLGNKLAVNLIWAKMKNEEFFLKSLAKSRENSELVVLANKISALADNVYGMLGSAYDSERIFGFEGMAATYYFSGLSLVIPLSKRDQEGKDGPNALLNYGYGILYGEIEKCCLFSGLDPYLGFLHTDRYGKPSLVLDLIEEFRPVIVDRALVTLYAQKQVLESDFEDVEGKKYLSKSGRRKMVEAVMERLHAQVNFSDKSLEIKAIVQDQARGIASFVKGESEFEPFLYRW